MTVTAPSSSAPTPSQLAEAELRAQCERQLISLDAVAQAATELALEIQARTLAAMRDEGDVHGVPTRALIAFNRAARVQRQTVMLCIRLRRELRGLDRPPSAAAAPGAAQAEALEDRIETVLRQAADADTRPDHELDALCAETAERLEREAFDPAITRSVETQIATLHDRLDFARRLADLPPPPPLVPAKAGIQITSCEERGLDPTGFAPNQENPTAEPGSRPEFIPGSAPHAIRGPG